MTVPGPMITTAELFEEYETGLRRYAYRLAGDLDEANDLVSETFLRAYMHLTLLGTLNPSQQKAWLYRVLKNRFIDERRVRKREQEIAAQMAWANNLAEPSVYRLDTFAQIPVKYGELIQMYYTFEMTSEEIGKKLGIPAATVRSRLRLALQWLRAHPSNFNR
jgi:RNA polymerase sigma-70 factor, ECF subfamily